MDPAGPTLGPGSAGSDDGSSGQHLTAMGLVSSGPKTASFEQHLVVEVQRSPFSWSWRSNRSLSQVSDVSASFRFSSRSEAILESVPSTSR